ncbi:hypothetical protein X801_05353, partial [Opisthorchis viverrini]
LVSLDLPNTKTFDDLVFIVSKAYNPEPSVIAQRFKFITRVQKEGDFVAELQSLTEHCDYGDFRNDMHRDRLVVGARNVRIQQCLLADSNLTLETAYDTAVALEAAENNATLLQSVQPTVTSESVDSSYQVEEKLNRLQWEGIIQNTKFSEWATPIVPILKPDGTVRICGDYKTTVNASTPPEHYPLPKIEDVYAQIDILITGCTSEEHLKLLKLAVDRLKECGLRIKKEKCDVLVDHVDYLGFRISVDGLAPLAEKIRPILEAPQPRNKHELRSFLGMVNHYARFIPQAATHYHPLNYLLRQGAKRALTNPLVLTHFDSTQPIVLACDASPYGVGAVLTQKDKSGILKPVAYASRSLSHSERKYAQIGKEALAILFGVTPFQHYLFGQTFDIFTDHKPLLVILGENKPIPQMTSPRMQRWALKLACYWYHLLTRELTADAISHLPLRDLPLHTPKPAELVNLMSLVADLSITATEIRVETKRTQNSHECYVLLHTGGRRMLEVH